jgi:hypothetical protein
MKAIFRGVEVIECKGNLTVANGCKLSIQVGIKGTRTWYYEGGKCRLYRTFSNSKFVNTIHVESIFTSAVRSL